MEFFEGHLRLKIDFFLNLCCTKFYTKNPLIHWIFGTTCMFCTALGKLGGPTFRMSKSHCSYYGWVLLFLNLLVTVYVSAFEVIPIAFSEKLITHFNVSISTFSYSMTCYFYAFGIFLIPVGILIDRYASQWLVLLGVLITGLGGIILAQSFHLVSVIFARMLMGLGATVGLIYGAKCLSDWFAPRKFAILLALFISLRLFFSLLVTFSLTQLLQLSTWQHILFYYGLCSIPLAFVILLSHYLSKKRSAPFALTTDIPWNQTIRQFFDSSQIWFIGGATGFFFGVILVFIAKWSVPFFRTAYTVSTQTINYLVILFCLGYLCGSFFFSYMSTSLEKRKMFIPWGILTTLLMLVIIIYPPYLPINSVMFVCFLCGFASAASFLGYVIIHEQSIPQLTATSIAAINVSLATAFAFTDPLVSAFLELEPAIQGATTYSLSDFQVSLFRIPIYLIFPLFLSLFVRETRATQRALN